MSKMKTRKKKESPDELKSRAKNIISRLKKMYPIAKTELEFQDPLQLLISTILSAQCTDVRVNIVTEDLFKKYKSAQDYTTVVPEELEQDIKSTGFYKNKAKNIIACCKTLVEKYDGKVPDSMDELVGLAGVGRKTANCVLGGAFGRAEGIVVDTHVQRLTERFAFSNEKSPEKIERELMNLVPQSYWYEFSNAMILHGRHVCNARKPKCTECALVDLCPSAEKFLTLSK